MAERPKSVGTTQSDTSLEVRHQRREARTALELAVVAMAPWSVVQRLAGAAGLLEALSELPPDSPPALALRPKVLSATREALEHWEKWQKEKLTPKLPRG